MELTKEDQDVLAVAEGKNVGDLALGNQPNLRRSDVINRHALRANIFPGDVVNRHNKTANFQFAWVPSNDDDFYQDLLEDGYQVVQKADWVLNREGWSWGVDGRLMNRREFLVYRNQDAYDREAFRRLHANDNSIKARHEDSVEKASRLIHDRGIGGVEVDAQIGGKPIDNGTRRTRS